MKRLYSNISVPWAVAKTVTAAAARHCGISSVGLNKQLLGMILTQIYLPEDRKMDLASSVPFPCSLVQ